MNYGIVRNKERFNLWIQTGTARKLNVVTWLEIDWGIPGIFIWIYKWGWWLWINKDY